MARPVLTGLMEALRAMADPSVMIVGDTESKGSDNYNQSLWDRRAISVQRWLTDSQMMSRITTMSKVKVWA